MSEIAKLYNDVMANAESEKTASAEDVEFDREFFEKVASGDEDATQVINDFIEQARSEGASDDDIEAAINEALEAAGIEDEGEGGEGDADEDEYETAKAAAYFEGANQALVDVLESDLAKEAGVTVDDVLDFELGGNYAAGYAEHREILDEVVTKIAEHKKEAKKGGSLAKRLMGKAKKGGAKAKGGAKRYGELLMGGAQVRKGGPRSGNMLSAFTGKGKSRHKTEALKSLGARAGTAAGLGGAGYGAYRMSKKDK